MLPYPTLAALYAKPEGKPELVDQLFAKGARHPDGIHVLDGASGNRLEIFGEYLCVLKPGGEMLIPQASKPTGRVRGGMFRVCFGRIYPWLTRLFTRSHDARDMMRYHRETMDACVPSETVLAAPRPVGFTVVKREPLLSLFSEDTAVKA